MSFDFGEKEVIEEHIHGFPFVVPPFPLSPECICISALFAGLEILLPGNSGGRTTLHFAFEHILGNIHRCSQSNDENSGRVLFFIGRNSKSTFLDSFPFWNLHVTLFGRRGLAVWATAYLHTASSTSSFPEYSRYR